MKEKLLIMLFRVLAKMPFVFSRKVGSMIGYLVYRFDRKTRNIVKRNISVCLPDLLQDKGDWCIKEVCCQTGMVASESAWIWGRPANDVISKVVRVNGRELLDASLCNDGGFIVAAPHLGNWEALGVWLGKHYSCYSMYRPPKMRGLDNYIRNGRESSGANLVPANQAGVRQLIKGMRRGGIAAILPDQEPAVGEGVFAPFFGIDAWTMTLVNRLAEHQKLPVVMAYAIRCADGFEITFRRLGDELMSLGLEEGAAVLNREIEHEVLQFPWQYQWSYKRFKTRPPEEGGGFYSKLNG